MKINKHDGLLDICWKINGFRKYNFSSVDFSSFVTILGCADNTWWYQQYFLFLMNNCVEYNLSFE